MKIFIPNDITIKIDRKELFVLCRPFYSDGKWMNNCELKKQWGIPEEVICTQSIEESEIMLLPYSINTYLNTNNRKALERYSNECVQHKIMGYGYISGDFGFALPEFKGLTYFRMGGFSSQLSNHNRGFPFALSDQHAYLYGTEEIQIREKSALPVVGFCGNASLSWVTRLKQIAELVIENARRALQNPFRKDWEPLFSSVYHRAKILKALERENTLKTNFIYREHYRAGVKTEEDLKRTTLEYYDNIRHADYVLCMRGVGNFSVRFYETLMMGRIPVFINTDCLLPFPEKINWKKHVVWVEWEDRNRIADAVADFHAQLSDSGFKELQIQNRKLWQEALSLRGILGHIKPS